MSTPQPLAGLRVVEFTHMVMGPTCGMVLADLGAEVIKVEPVEGEGTRRLLGAGAGFFPMFNRNKKSIGIDLKQAEGAAVARRLALSADVVAENFKPGVLTKFGLDYASLAAHNDQLVYVSHKGFLPGPYEHRTALDEVVQNQHHPAVASGKIEAAAILSFQWGGTIPEMSVTIIPYLMTSVAKQKAFIGSEASKLLDAKMEAKGVKNIAWIVDTNDGIFTSSKKLLVTPADFTGLKIRGLNKLFDAGLAAMGASPSAMPGSEVYQALQTGVLDAGFTGVKAANSRKFFEVQKFGVASNIILAYDNLVVNPAWWNGLPAPIRSAIQKAADAAVQRSVRAADGVPPEDVKVLNDKGMQTIALTKAQEKQMSDAMQPAVKKEFLRATAPDGVKLLELIDRL